MSTNGVNRWRTQPMYAFGEAAHLAGVSTSTVRNWLFGYVTRDREVQPLLPAPADQGPMVSFLQMIEIVVAGRFRKAEHVSFPRVRQAYENAQSEFQLEHPFAHLMLEALGGHIAQRMHDEPLGISLRALDEPAQWSLPGLVLDLMEQLVYEQDLVARWYPKGKDVPIVVDPRISAGIPTVDQRGITIEAVHKRGKAGQRISFIDKDVALTDDLVEQVLQYAEQVTA